MLARAESYGLSGIEGYRVEVEVDINNGMPAYETVGLPDAAVKESRERVRSAIKNSGFLYPPTRITINLAPADTKKSGALYDLPIALGILAATDQLDYRKLLGITFIGELSLDGRIRHCAGVLPILISAKKEGIRRAVIPAENAREASYLTGLEIYPVQTLREAVALADGDRPNPLAPADIESMLRTRPASGDFMHIRGQYRARRAAEVAAAGGHNFMMIGPPGSGKTMIARALPSILPDLTVAEALETTKIHSVAGILDREAGIVCTRPFRTPHHTSTAVALIGGGNKAMPGEISYAHNGVLFLDEMPEYTRHTLESLRQPLEDGVMSVSRILRSVQYPSKFMLVAGMNPCPCGNYGSPELECKCSPAQIHKYFSKISGPLLDRIDIQVEVDPVKYEELSGDKPAEPSAAIKARVDAARAVQLARFEGTGIYCNAAMTREMLASFCRLSAEAGTMLKAAFDKFKMSARGHDRILKVARTIADLEGAEDIALKHLMEALQYRCLDRKFTF